MVIVQLMGGLGNQMFQYAYARRLSFALNLPLKLDISKFKTGQLRFFELNVFDIPYEIASWSEIKRYEWAGKARFRLGFPANSCLYIPKIVREHSFSYSSALLSEKGKLYLQGYWQSEKYFKDVEGIIRQDFTLIDAPNEQNTLLLRQIKETNAVSLHVRRGDYVSNPAINLVHGTCELSYYQRAVDFVAARLQKPHFFVFSDDPLWVRANLSLQFPTTHISNNGVEKGHEDLRLMSACRHNILANSSFSWWGGWLNSNPDKIVVAPERWFRSNAVNTADLIPAHWVRL